MKTRDTLDVPGYQVVQFLGSGARSTIWHVRESETGHPFALKRVVKAKSSDSRFIEQAVNEYEVGSSLEHPGVRRIHLLRRHKRLLRVREVHLLMELCEGLTLQSNRPQDIGAVVRVFGEVANSLAYMNASGYVHADTKPNNIIIATDGTVKLIDLGQSCRIGTVKKRIQGTPDFIAPEQVHRHPLDARTDVYNFGAALYWTLTGRAIPTALATAKKRGVYTVNMSADMPEELNPNVTTSLSKLVMDCIERKPARRPENMNDVARRLSLIAHTIKRNNEHKGE